MFKLAVVLCLACFVIIEARPKMQYLPYVPGYVPVYIQTDNLPLDQIHPMLAEAFPSAPAGRSALKQIQASYEQPEPVMVEPEPEVKVEEPAVKAQEPEAKMEEPEVKAEEPAVKVEEPVVMAEEPAVKAEEPAVLEKKVASVVDNPER